MSSRGAGFYSFIPTKQRVSLLETTFSYTHALILFFKPFRSSDQVGASSQLVRNHGYRMGTCLLYPELLVFNAVSAKILPYPGVPSCLPQLQLPFWILMQALGFTCRL